MGILEVEIIIRKKYYTISIRTTSSYCKHFCGDHLVGPSVGAPRGYHYGVDFVIVRKIIVEIEIEAIKNS